MAAIRGEIHGVVEGRVGQPPLAGPGERYPVQLELHWVIAVVCQVKHAPGLFVHVHNILHVELMLGQSCEQLPAQVVQINIFPAGALGNPEEALAVFEKAHGRGIFRPTRRPFLAHDHARLACFGIGRAKLHDVLLPVSAVKEQLPAVG